MGKTIGRHWPENAPRGDYQALCDYCGVMWRRSQLYRDRAGLLVCPDEGNGRDMVTLGEGNAAAASRKRQPPPNRGGSWETTPYPIADKLVPDASGGATNWHMIYQGVTLETGKEYEVGIYAKEGGYNSIAALMIGTPVVGAPYPYGTYNVEDGEVIDSRGTTPTMTLQKEWWYCSYTVKTIGSGLAILWLVVQDDLVQNFYGNDRDGIFAWGASVKEVGTETNLIESPNDLDDETDWSRIGIRIWIDQDSVDRSLL